MATPEHGRFRSGLHLLGFGTLREGVAKIAFGLKAKALPGTNSYFDLVGKIWLQEQGGYMNVPGFVIGLFVEQPQGWGAGYFNR